MTRIETILDVARRLRSTQRDTMYRPMEAYTITMSSLVSELCEALDFYEEELRATAVGRAASEAAENLRSIGDFVDLSGYESKTYAVDPYQELRLQCVSITCGDLGKAKDIYEWVKGEKK